MAKANFCQPQTAVLALVVCVLACTTHLASSFTVPASEWPWQPQNNEHFAAATAAAAAAPTRDLADNIKFPSPWNTTVGNMYIIRLLPLNQTIVPPRDYAVYNQASEV